MAEAYAGLPMTFEANQGQTDSSVEFFARGNGYNLYLARNQATLALRKNKPATPAATKQDDADARSDTSSPNVLRMKLVGARQDARMIGQEPLPAKSNYFIGNDPAAWRTDVHTYARVEQRDVYPGINLIYYGNQQELEYDFVVAPFAHPETIRLAFDGARRIQIDASGDLLIELSTGGELLRQHKPLIYQEAFGARREVAGRYVIKNKREVGFKVADYDASKPLVIDPVLSYSTYLGGSSIDEATSIAIDSSGNAYVTGETLSTNFPVRGSFQSLNAGNSDAFVFKLDSTGALVYSTYIGGSVSDRGNGIAVDASGNAYVIGRSNSLNFPTTAGAFQTSYRGGDFDAFIFKLNAQGSALVYSSYIGGTENDSGLSVAVDASGNAHLTGGTRSVDFPTTASAYQPAISGGTDWYVMKLNAAGSAPVYSTFLGGSATDRASGIAVDSSGNAYVAGYSNSTDFPMMNALQSLSGGSYDAVIVKLNAAGGLIFSTYYGGSGDDRANAVALDASGNVYVTGQTASQNLTVTNAFQSAYGGGASDAFVIKLNSAGTSRVYATYLGGSGDDKGYGIAVDSSGNAFITGQTASTNFPVTNALQPAKGSGGIETDAFVTKLNSNGNALGYSTFLGGALNDTGFAIALNSVSTAFIAGKTDSTNFPTLNPYQSVNSGGGGDVFVTKIADTGNATPALFVATLNAAQEVPPTNSGATGTATVLLSPDETTARVSLNFTGLSSAQTAAHIHGAAPAGTNAPVLFPLPLGSFSDYQISLTSAQVQNLKAGLLYTNVHSTIFTGGEIRGQFQAIASAMSFQFSSAAFSVAENGASASLTVTRFGDTSTSATVDYTTTDGTASERSDYIPVSGTLRFAAGETSKTFTVLIVDDAYVEGNETVNLALKNPSAMAFLGSPNTAALTISDNDAAQPTTNPIDGAQFFVRQHYLDFLNREPDAGGLSYWSNKIAACGTNAACITRERINVSAAFFVEQEFQQTGSFVYRLYKASYGRRPTYAEFVADRNRLVVGTDLETSKQTLTNEFVARPEFTQKYPLSLTGDQFVDALLQTIRQSSGVDLASQRTALVNTFNQCIQGSPVSPATCRAQVVRLTIDNIAYVQAEYNPAFVLMQYFGYLRREPDEAGYNFWLNILNNRDANNYRGMVCAFITSPEYQSRFSPIVTRTDRECGAAQ